MPTKKAEAKEGELLRAFVKKGGPTRFSGAHLVKLTLDNTNEGKLATNPRTRTPFRIPVDETAFEKLKAGEELPIPRIWLKLGWRAQVIRAIEADGVTLGLGSYPVFVSAMNGRIERLVRHPDNDTLFEVTHWTKKRHMTMG